MNSVEKLKEVKEFLSIFIMIGPLFIFFVLLIRNLVLVAWPSNQKPDFLWMIIVPLSVGFLIWGHLHSIIILTRKSDEKKEIL